LQSEAAGQQPDRAVDDVLERDEDRAEHQELQRHVPDATVDELGQERD
jgi:hypothetical protein